MGMLPRLVDSGKKADDPEIATSRDGVISPSTEIGLIRYEPLNEAVKEIISEQFCTIYAESSISKDLYARGKFLFPGKKWKCLVIEPAKPYSIESDIAFLCRNLHS